MPKMQLETVRIGGIEVKRPVRVWNGEKFFMANHGENRARLRELASLHRIDGGHARIMSYGRGWALYIGM